MKNKGKERYTNVLYSKISYNEKLFRNSKYFYIFNPTCTIVKLLARNNIMPDVDIDFYDRDNTLKLFKHAPASIIRNDKIEKHKTGVYFHSTPVHPVSGQSTLDYKEAEERGYFKIDCLNVNLYKEIKSEEELVELMIQTPDWDILQDKKIVDQLFHLNGHFDIVSTLKPKTIEQLAMVLAIIRPAKRYLLTKSWQEIETDVW